MIVSDDIDMNLSYPENSECGNWSCCEIELLLYYV
jgi:hypothetical protein